jgi:hypothetical protein
MPNKWVLFVKEWAAKKGISYPCAVSTPECRNEYQKLKTLEKKKENKKKKPSSVEDEERMKKDKLSMLEEDVRSQLLRQTEKTKGLKKKLTKELKEKQEEKRRNIEMSRMMGEDINVSKKKAKKVSETADGMVIRKITYEGKTYIIAKETGLIYDYDLYKKTRDLKRLGVWNETKKRIEFFDREYPEQESVKKITYDKTKYLKSKETGLIYDYDLYKNTGDQKRVGVWNETTKKIDFFDDDDEESESEIESETD